MKLTRRRFLLAAGGIGAGLAGAAWALRSRLRDRLSRLTRDPAFTATPPLVPHDPARDRRTIAVAQGMVTANEHTATGFTGCCKSAMGVVDMSAGRLGSDPRVRDYRSVHHFGSPDASWRMAGPLAHFAREVRAPDLYVAVAEWVAAAPGGRAWDDEREDARLEEAAAHRTRTVVAGTDPVAIDAWCVRHLLMPIRGSRAPIYDLDDPEAKVTRFLRYYRQVHGSGTLDERLVTVV